jgi:hypothetical protein
LALSSTDFRTNVLILPLLHEVTELLSDAEKTFSFLHNEFRFKKTKNASDEVYIKLVNMIQKEKKKKEKLKIMSGGDNKIILKLH